MVIPKVMVMSMVIPMVRPTVIPSVSIRPRVIPIRPRVSGIRRVRVTPMVKGYGYTQVRVIPRVIPRVKVRPSVRPRVIPTVSVILRLCLYYRVMIHIVLRYT